MKQTIMKDIYILTFLNPFHTKKKVGVGNKFFGF